MLIDLINKINAYINIGTPNASLISTICDYVFQFIKTLGFNYNITLYDGNDHLPELMKAVIDTRSSMRELTRDKNIPKEIKQKLFEILDKERNILLPDAGIKLEDTKNTSSWFLN